MIRPDRSRMVGMAGGTLWLVGVSSAFAIFSLWWIGAGTVIAASLLAAVIVLTSVTIAIALRALAAARRLPADSRATDDGSTMRSYRNVVVAEILGIAVVNVVCGIVGRRAWMAPLDLIVVGVHFVALARLFHVPRYAVMGWLFCAFPILTMLAMPELALVGRAPAWFVVPSLSCSLAVWVTAAENLRELRGRLREA